MMPRLPCLAMLGLLLSSPVFGGQIQVSPIKLEYAPGQRVQQLRLGNPGDKDMVLQVELFAWDQVDNKFVLSANREFIATPPILEVPAHQRKVVRIGPRKPPSGACEVSYRVVITEIPKQHSSSQPVRFRSQVTMPLFARSQDNCSAKLSWQRDGQQLVINNVGTAYTQISKLRIVSSNKTWPLQPANLGYVLAGKTSIVTLPDDIPANAKLILETKNGEVSGPLAQSES